MICFISETRREATQKRDFEYKSCKVLIARHAGADKLAMMQKSARLLKRSVSVSTTPVRSILKSTANRSSFFGRRKSVSGRVQFDDTQIINARLVESADTPSNDVTNEMESISLIDLSNDNEPNHSKAPLVPPINFIDMPAVTATANVVSGPSTDAMNTSAVVATNQKESVRSMFDRQRSSIDEFDPLKTPMVEVQMEEKSQQNSVIADILDLYKRPSTSRPIPALIPINRAVQNTAEEYKLSYPGQGLLSYEVYTRAVQTLQNATSQRSDNSTNGLFDFSADNIDSVESGTTNKVRPAKSYTKAKHLSKNDSTDNLFDFWAKDIEPIEIDTNYDCEPIEMNASDENFGAIQYDSDVINLVRDPVEKDTSGGDFDALRYESDSDF